MNTADLQKLSTPPELLERLRAGGRRMTAEEVFEQRVSWVYGQCGDGVTKEQVRKALKERG